MFRSLEPSGTHDIWVTTVGRPAPVKILDSPADERDAQLSLDGCWILRGDELWSAQVVRAEVLAGMRPAEEAATRDLLRLVTWVDVDESLAEAAGALGRQFLASHPGIEVTDLIVAALAQHLDAVLKTTNVKHFPMIKGLKAPY